LLETGQQRRSTSIQPCRGTDASGELPTSFAQSIAVLVQEVHCAGLDRVGIGIAGYITGFVGANAIDGRFPSVVHRSLTSLPPFLI